MSTLIEKLYRQFHLSSGMSTDTRDDVRGKIYFGLKGERFDGSAFGDHALEKGASAVVVRPGTCRPGPEVFETENPLLALQQLALHHRRQLTIPVIGITGSNGKTTTKELLWCVLSTRMRALATEGNLNNHIGVPLTLLRIRPDHEVAIVEMGANHIGEIRDLCELALPTHGIVTNVGKAHLEGFGSMEGVRIAKGELYDSLAANDGTAFVNLDEAYLEEMSKHVDVRIHYSVSDSAAYDTGKYTFSARGGAHSIDLDFVDESGHSWRASSRLFGKFNQSNIATAIAAGLYFRIPGDAICAAISSYIPQNNRMQQVRIGGKSVILDAYNANPTSMSLAIRSFAEIDHPCKVLILGAMMELGASATNEHLDIARLARTLPGAQVILIGEHFREAAGQFGLIWHKTVQELMPVLSGYLPEEVLILVKGSRAMRLEDVLRVLE